MQTIYRTRLMNKINEKDEWSINENINVQNPKREARLNVYSYLFDKLQFNKMNLGLQKKVCQTHVQQTFIMNSIKPS